MCVFMSAPVWAVPHNKDTVYMYTALIGLEWTNWLVWRRYKWILDSQKWPQANQPLPEIRMAGPKNPWGHLKKPCPRGDFTSRDLWCHCWIEYQSDDVTKNFFKIFLNFDHKFIQCFQKYWLWWKFDCDWVKKYCAVLPSLCSRASIGPIPGNAGPRNK